MKRSTQAIARRDPESARAAMRIHLTNSRERLRRAQEATEAAARAAAPGLNSRFFDLHLLAR